MTQTVYDLAHELERSIRQLPEYQAILATKAEIDANPEAKTVLADFARAQEKLQEQVQLGQFPGEKEQEEMEALGQRIEAIPSLRQYFEQQQRLSIYMADLEKIIFAPLGDLLK